MLFLPRYGITGGKRIGPGGWFALHGASRAATHIGLLVVTKKMA
jgi:hypothetical protein